MFFSIATAIVMTVIIFAAIVADFVVSDSAGSLVLNNSLKSKSNRIKK